MRTSKKIQKKTNFQNLKIGKEPLPPIDYNTSLSSYKDNYEDMVGRAFYEVPLEGDIEYCTNRNNILTHIKKWIWDKKHIL